ncbi:DNA primase [Limosilactobacillus frumenti DSM 13145]|uniref:DNA primase n=1 Tax=Limosilactobacillus frumenti DSM 13145 TaxID=1423746 RepID=A0A0R1P373_9LACO|nr:DNA primase [Limosilactobacillus frumenti]KRL27037.1 DNA primase [Limosilactobacillus frumenti DSM 13145]MBA2914214.1 DNA primase [Limosilactobacillus frumenti]QFG72511.1 DNA primase [Limosilactobacillus frumenti]
MARIPRELIDQVRDAVDIADVIGQYVQLHQSGKNFVGLCPFHEERTPSFSVNESKQFFYCFGCGRGGNVFQFLMDLKHYSFVEAVQEVAQLGNITIPDRYREDSHQEKIPDNSEKGQLMAVHEQAAELYHHILVNTPAGEPALKYLHRRGMSDEMIKQFQIGYAPDQKILKPFCDQHGYQYQLLRKSGLFTESSSGELHDRFIDRVMYPLKNQNGRVIAFSGRILNTASSDLPKYLNSPETPIFNKRRTLFNFDLARKAARKGNQLYLFEGFMDVISAFSAGVENGVASMGTSLTEEQVGLLGRACRHLVICYDGDSAGQNAIDRAISLVNDHRPAGMQLRIVQLPAGVDPDEYVQQKGREEFKNYLGSHVETPVDFYFNFYRHGHNLNQQSDLLAYINQILKLLAQLQSPVEQDLYLERLASEFNLDKATLKVQLEEIRPQPPQYHYPAANQGSSNNYNPGSAPLDRHTQATVNRTERAEQLLLRYMLADREVWTHVTAHKDFHFVHERYQTLYLVATSYFAEQNNYSVAGLMDYLSEDELRTTLGQIEELNVDERVDMQVVDDCLQLIMKSTPLETQIKDVRAQLREASSLNNSELATNLTMKLVDLLKQQQQLKTEEIN